MKEIIERKSIRKYKSDELKKADIETILQASRHACTFCKE